MCPGGGGGGGEDRGEGVMSLSLRSVSVIQ